MDNEIVKTITARFYEDAEWKHVEDLLLSKMESLQEFSQKDLDKWQGSVEEQITARMLCYNILKDFLAETKLVNREIPIYKNKFK
jgi:hypothetical protein